MTLYYNLIIKKSQYHYWFDNFYIKIRFFTLFARFLSKISYRFSFCFIRYLILVFYLSPYFYIVFYRRILFFNVLSLLIFSLLFFLSHLSLYLIKPKRFFLRNTVLLFILSVFFDFLFFIRIFYIFIFYEKAFWAGLNLLPNFLYIVSRGTICNFCYKNKENPFFRSFYEKRIDFFYIKITVFIYILKILTENFLSIFTADCSFPIRSSPLYR